MDVFDHEIYCASKPKISQNRRTSAAAQMMGVFGRGSGVEASGQSVSQTAQAAAAHILPLPLSLSLSLTLYLWLPTLHTTGCLGST